MNVRKCVTLLLASVGALGSVGAVAQPDPRPGATTPVHIMGPLPVPVTGTVSGTVSVSGTVPVTGTVGLTPGSSVSIANPASNPVLVRDVDAGPRRIAYQSTQTPNCFGVLCEVTFPTVPANHRLVIQHLTANATFGGANTFVLVALVTGGQGGSNFFAPFVNGGQTSSGITAFDKEVLVYIDGGGAPIVSIQINTGARINGAQLVKMSG